MSTKVVTAVFERSEARGNDRLVLLAIADEADDDGTNAYPSIDRIAKKVRLPKRTVMRCLVRLEEIAELVVHRPETNGRGHFNRYEVALVKGDTLAPEPDADRREKARKGARPRTISDRPTDPQTQDLNRDATEPVVTESTPSAVDDVSDVDRLCAILASLVAIHRDAKPPPVTASWRRDMRLLLERGPLGQDEPERLTPDHVERAMRYTFDRLAVRGGDGFCWADQVQSPGALRRHYHRIRLARRAQQQTANSKGTQTVDRVARRLMGETGGAPAPRQPLGLLPGATKEV